MDEWGSADVNGEDAHSGDEESSGRWLPVTGPLPPTRAAVLSVALEKAGIAVAFIRPEEYDVFPTEFGAHRPGQQQLAVLEEHMARARAIVARVDAVFPLNATTRSPAFEPPVADPRPVVRPAEEPFVARARSAEVSTERAFEARRVRRYTEGLFIFVVGLVWTLAVLSRAQPDALFAVVGVGALCTGLLMIYAALSMRKGEEEDGGGEGSEERDRPSRPDSAGPQDEDE